MIIFGEKGRLLAEGQDSTYGLDLYDFHARLFNPALPVFDRPDPLAEDFTWLTPYNYCAGDPVNLIDPTGCSLQVVFIDSTRYMVVDGAFDDDNTIYEVAWNDEGELERTGKTIGETATEWSFYDSDTKSWASGSIIDLSADSAYPFMEKIDDDGENLLTYMEKGRNGQEYDFKIRGDKYRGMLASFMGGAETIASARDIGNYAAGYKAGSKGLSPVITFAGFSAYDCKKNGRIGIEPSGSRKPQWMGYKSGFKKYLRKSIGL